MKEGEPPNPMPPSLTDCQRPQWLVPPPLLYRLSLVVNSYYHQGIFIVGDGVWYLRWRHVESNIIHTQPLVMYILYALSGSVGPLIVDHAATVSHSCHADLFMSRCNGGRNAYLVFNAIDRHAVRSFCQHLYHTHFISFFLFFVRKDEDERQETFRKI